MIRIIDAHDVITGSKKYFRFAGTTSDTKPVNNTICTGSLFHEVDTTKVYAYNEDASSGEEWVEQITLGGDD